MVSRYRQSAQISLALLIATTITVGMLLLTLVLVGQSYRGLESAKLAAARDSATQLSVNVNDRIRAITNPPSLALTLLSQDPLREAGTLEPRLRRLPVVASILSQSDIVSAVYAGYDNGEFFLLRKVESSGRQQFPDAPLAAKYLLQTVTRTAKGEMVGEWHFYDAALNLLSRTVRPGYRFDPRTRPWYRSATDLADTALTSPYIFFTTREVGLTLSRPFHANGGVMGIDVTVTDLSRQLQQLRLTPSTQIAIVDSQDSVIALSNPDDLLGDNPEQQELVTLDQLPDPTLGRLAQLTPEAGMVPFDSQGEEYYGLSVALDSLSANELRIVLAIPADELLADVWASLSRQTKIAAAIALLLLILGWFLGNRVGKPLENLTNRVSALSRFRFDTSVRVDSHIREAHRLSTALDDMAKTIRSFQNISLTLNRGKNLDELLQDVLEQIVHIVGQRRGAIYLYSRTQQRLNLAVNERLQLSEHIENIGPDADDNDVLRQLRREITGHPIFAILRNRRQDLVGALVIEMEVGEQTHLSDDLIVFVNEIAGSAAVAIETRELIESQQALLDGIIRLVANAIDTKSPYTSGHCNRVPELAKMLVDEAARSQQEPFRHFHLNDDEAYEFHLAAWLHDCGKITSPEYVVDKATKLETIYNRIHEVRTRFEVLHRDAEIQYLRDLQAGAEPTDAQRRRDDTQAALQEEFALVARANIGGEFMSQADIDRVHTIGQRTWLRHFSDRIGLSRDELERLAGQPAPPLPAKESLLADKPGHLEPWGDRIPPVTRDDPRNRWGFDMALPEHAFNRGELYNLSIERGTLTPEERFKINEHIVQTIVMLDALPLPDKLSRVPHLAGTHHERMDGEGYPCRLGEAELGIPEKVMAIADIFEALTARDRPYKEGKPLTEALGIMTRMVNDGHIDAEVFRLFIRSRVYRRYAETYLSTAQIDTVDEEALLAQLAQAPH
ncbi:MAG: HD domain-containing phosphohydrolase [Marinobacter sp.]|uniref:HD domain-containing phosphohydrolase n=1 Tax=Marinobacter sp. TaxID=50741 RepID=UPI00299E0763|nr:HD domain-containing phosphohydrolase [Marinobacter sp.]MDX1754579.1 HD domain-containing phosphohydrolase [Marinobacter sp.]